MEVEISRRRDLCLECCQVQLQSARYSLPLPPRCRSTKNGPLLLGPRAGVPWWRRAMLGRLPRGARLSVSSFVSGGAQAFMVAPRKPAGGLPCGARL